MNTVTISADYEIAIPAEIRESLGLRPGGKVRVVQFEDRIEIVPVKDILSLRGFLKGMSGEFVRDEDRI